MRHRARLRFRETSLLIDSSIAAVVTGAASGLGEATARMLAAQGAKVAVFDMQEEKGRKVAAEIGGVYCNCLLYTSRCV